MQQFSGAAAQVLRFINQTHRPVFLTGKAGTGKTTLLREIIRTTHKNTVVVAPTGIAALNAGGVTIHSMFGLPLSSFVPENVTPQVSDRFRLETRHSLKRHFRLSAQKRAVLTGMELLVIDEVSMLRADLLDAVDFTLQYIRKNQRPFGGVQVLYIGDLQQLPPVVKDEEWKVLSRYYKGKYFFHARAIGQDPPLYIELTHIYRQSDPIFIGILNSLRHNRISPQEMQRLNRHVREDFDLKTHPGYIILTTHNAKADAINARSLLELKADPTVFRAEITGDFPDKIYPLDQEMTLKVGAQVMFVKNDPSPEKQFFNGKMGIVKTLSEAELFVHFPEEGKTIAVQRYEWQHIRYSVDEHTKDIVEEVIGTFVQYPVKLAWAITVHKSQGLTFDRAALDVSDVFMPGQAYVALSRLRSLDGLVLLSPIRMNGMRTDDDVTDFAEKKADERDLDVVFERESRRFLRDVLLEGFHFDDLTRLWKEQLESYGQTAKGERSKSLEWTREQAARVASWVEPARKFQWQLDRLFAVEPPDLSFIASRLEAAIGYFRPLMETVLEAVLWKLEEIARMRKAKAFYQEVEEIETALTRALVKLLRCRDMAMAVQQGKVLDKETLSVSGYANHRQQLQAKVREAFKAANTELIDEEDTAERYSRNRKKEPKEKKKSTVIQTYDLWIEKHSIRDIAQLRNLTVQTINNHMAKLIEARAVSITEILPHERLRELTEIFKGYDEESLQPLKERYGDRFTWDELKLFKAALTAQGTSSPDTTD